MKDIEHLYSKMLPIVTGIIFVVTLIFSFSVNLDSTFDTAIYTTAITVTGAIFGSSIVWYGKKRSKETSYELRIDILKESSKQRLWFNREMFKLMKKYNLTENDIDKVNAMGSIDEMMDSAESSAVSLIDDMENESESDDEVQTFSI